MTQDDHEDFKNTITTVITEAARERSRLDFWRCTKILVIIVAAAIVWSLGYAVALNYW